MKKIAVRKSFNVPSIIKIIKNIHFSTVYDDCESKYFNLKRKTKQNFISYLYSLSSSDFVVTAVNVYQRICFVIIKETVLILVMNFATLQKV